MSSFSHKKEPFLISLNHPVDLKYLIEIPPEKNYKIWLSEFIIRICTQEILV